MEKKVCAVFIFDGFGDHEISLTMAWLNGIGSGDFVIETFSTRGQPVTSMSGLRIVPDTTLKVMDPEDFDLLLLPGGEKWEKGDNLDVFPLIMTTAGKKPIVALCSGVLPLGDLGLLDEVPHTGNYQGYINRYCSEYKGGNRFLSRPCVNADGIITANGTAIADLACEILKVFGGFDEQKGKDWQALYLSGGCVTAFFEKTPE